jgi:hypothetical protein
MVVSTPVCLNLGPRGVRRRRLTGYLSFLVGLGLSVWFIWSNMPDWVRALVFIPYFISYGCILEAMQKTCLLLAFRGKQNLDGEVRPLDDPRDRGRLWARGVWMLLVALFMAALCTYLTLAIHVEFMTWPAGPAPGPRP